MLRGEKIIIIALKAAHISDWLFGLLISSCGLRMCNETTRVAVGVRLGLNLCEAHTCPCGALVSTRGIHGLSCKRSAGRSTWHQQIKDLIWWALQRCYVPANKEPSGLLKLDGKRPDGLTLVRCQNGRYLTWDATVVDSLASSYLSAISSLPGSAAETAVVRKRSKYATITLTHIFVPVAVESLGPVNAEGLRFLNQIGDRLSAVTRECRPFYIKGCLWLFNALTCSPFAAPSSPRRTSKLSHSRLWLYLSFLTLWILTNEGTKNNNNSL